MTQHQVTFTFTAGSDIEARAHARRIYEGGRRHVPELELVGLAVATWREVALEPEDALEAVALHQERASDGAASFRDVLDDAGC
jgi:hypothetical protein